MTNVSKRERQKGDRKWKEERVKVVEQREDEGTSSNRFPLEEPMNQWQTIK